ncbi:MAG: tetratricopeptide repeat protein [Planctomycetota bacterium]
MKSIISGKVKVFWPFAAFVVAAILVVSFLRAQRDISGGPSELELRQGRYKILLQNVRNYTDRKEYHEAADVCDTVEKEYSDLIRPADRLDIARAIHRIYPNALKRINAHLDLFFEHFKGQDEEKEGYALRGEMCNLAGEYEKAVELLERAIHGEPKSKDHARVYMELGRAYFELGEYSKAAGPLEDVGLYSIQPRAIAVANFLLGQIRTGIFDKSQIPADAEAAIANFDYNRYQPLYPDLRYASRVRIADILLALGKYDQAGEAYLSALDVLPSVKQMQTYLEESPGAGKDELLRLQVIGKQPEYMGDEEQATRLERVIAHLVAEGNEDGAARLLCRIAPYLEDKCSEYRRAAILFERCARRLDLEIREEKEEISRLSVMLLGTIGNDRLAQKRNFVVEAEQSRNDYLRLAAEYNEKAFDEDPYSSAISANPLQHPLWKSALLHIERGAPATAERVLLKITSPRYIFPTVLTVSARMSLGEIYRKSGRFENALRIFRYVRGEQGGPEAKGRADFLGKAALEEALTLADLGRMDEAEAVLKDLLRDDNTFGIGIYSKVWWEGTFVLGRLYYNRALAASSDRMQAFIQASDLLRDAVIRYRDLAEPETIYKSTFYLADCLHQAAIEAISKQEKSRALLLFREARQFFEQVISFDSSALDISPLYYRNSRLLYADTFFFDARLSEDEAHRKEMYARAIQEYTSVTDALHGTEQGAWALVQMGNVYKMLGNTVEADRQFDKAASAIAKLEDNSDEMSNNPEGFDRAYVELLLKWFRNRSS